MAILFLDASALVKRCVAEAGSEWVTGLLAPGRGNTIHISVVSGAEVVAALVRRQRSGSLSPHETSLAIAEFTDDWAHLFDVVRADRELVAGAMGLAQRFGLRGYDAIQLASALEVRAFAQQSGLSCTLVSSDGELNVAAASDGLAVEDPNSH